MRYGVKRLVVVSLMYLLGMSSFAASAERVGWWTFKNGNADDLTGHFGATTLFGASLVNGQLAVSAVNQSFARTERYTGPTLTSKTLVAWVYLDRIGFFIFPVPEVPVTQG